MEMERAQFRLLTMALYIIMRILLNKKDKDVPMMMGQFARRNYEEWAKGDETLWARYIGIHTEPEAEDDLPTPWPCTCIDCVAERHERFKER